MESKDQNPKSWSNTQTYTMAVICLILGLAVGYLQHSPESARASIPQSTIAPPPMPGGPSGQMNRPMPSAADMKRMADKQVAPLLADLQKNPKDPDLLAKIGHSYLAAQQLQDARQYYEQSVAVKATPETLNDLSYVYCSLGDVDKGIDAVNRGLKIEPKNPKLLFNLGVYLWRGKSDPKGAIAAWEMFLKADPNNPKRAEVETMIAQAKKHLNLPPNAKTDKPSM